MNKPKGNTAFVLGGIGLVILMGLEVSYSRESGLYVNFGHGRIFSSRKRYEEE